MTIKTLARTIVFLLGFVMIAQNAFADLPEPKKNESPNMTAGRKAIEAKDFKSAVGHLTKAIQENSKDADAHSMLGFTYRKLGTFDKSMEHYQTALKLEPNH